MTGALVAAGLALCDPAGAQTPAAPAAKAAAPVKAAAGPLSDRAVVERANAYLNGLGTIAADFAQTAGDGRRYSGRLFLQRPGKLRFEYDAPTPLEIVSDGNTVLVRDRKLNTSDAYPLSQTPLKFLLSSPIDLTREVTLTNVTADADGARIAFEDRSTLGGTSRITLFFNSDVTALTRWRIIDPQGGATTVALSGIERNAKVDPRTFNLNFMRKVD